jgi:putative addiction module component (TIGR02574 family)
MTEEVNELLKKAMALPGNERAELAGSLLETLDETVDEDVEAAWQNEIALRIQELDSGKSMTIPWHDVRRRFASKLSEHHSSL